MPEKASSDTRVSAGSHDTMTYCLSRKSPISQARSRLLHLLGRLAPCITGPMVLKWSVTQVRWARGGGLPRAGKSW